MDRFFLRELATSLEYRDRRCTRTRSMLASEEPVHRAWGGLGDSCSLREAPCTAPRGAIQAWRGAMNLLPSGRGGTISFTGALPSLVERDQGAPRQTSRRGHLDRRVALRPTACARRGPAERGLIAHEWEIRSELHPDPTSRPGATPQAISSSRAGPRRAQASKSPGYPYHREDRYRVERHRAPRSLIVRAIEERITPV